MRALDVQVVAVTVDQAMEDNYHLVWDLEKYPSLDLSYIGYSHVGVNGEIRNTTIEVDFNGTDWDIYNDDGDDWLVGETLYFWEYK